MVNKKVTKQNILDALIYIDKNGVPKNRVSTKFNLFFNDKIYPPKYVLSIATKIAVGIELKPSQFNGGDETNDFLNSLGFNIHEGSRPLESEKSKRLKTNKHINICTAVFQTIYSSDWWDNKSNKDKLELLLKILKRLKSDTDILILPAGFLNSGGKRPETIFGETERMIANLIKAYHPEIFVCFGIDGRHKTDQLALSINKTGIIAIARKFHHMDQSICLAKNAFASENKKERHFLIKGKRPYLAVCYDVFGISHNKLENEGKYDFIIGTIHGFDSRGGDSDFARKGLAGASKQWAVHSFASACFNDNRNPTNWTSGVKWTHGDASVKDFTYDEIKIESELQMVKTDLETVYLRYYQE